MSSMFASLKVHNYGVFAAGALASNIGTWMGRVAQDWLVLTELTDHDATALGIVTGLQFAPMVLLAPLAGSLADRYSKRKLLMLTQVGLGLNAAVLAGLMLSGAAQLWHVYLLALLMGVTTAVDNPARQAFVSEMVPKDLLTNAVSLNSASFNGARLIGPAAAGLLIAWVGTGPTLVLNALSFAAVLTSLFLMRPSELTPAPRASGRGGVREGLRYVKKRKDIQLLMFIVFMLGTFGMNFQITIALMSTQIFGRGAAEFGFLGSVMAIGSLAAALMAARRSRPRLRVLLAALIGFTVASAAAALAPTFWFFAVALVPTGLFALTVMTTANAAVQLATTPVMRGRVMALYMAIFLGGTPLGAPAVGWVGGAWGARWTILIGSIACGLTAVGAILYLMRSKDLQVRLDRRRPMRLLVTPRHPAAVVTEQVN